MDYTCENCDQTKHEDDMHMLDPVLECRDCAEATENYWAGWYNASGRQPGVAGGYDLDDPKHPEWAERLFETVGR